MACTRDECNCVGTRLVVGSGSARTTMCLDRYEEDDTMQEAVKVAYGGVLYEADDESIERINRRQAARRFYSQRR